MKLTLPALGATTVIVILWMLRYAGYGFSFSDEGFYLNWMAHAALYKYSLTQFGFVYRPLYRLVAGDVVLLRGVNLILTFLLALMTGARVFRLISDSNRSPAASGEYSRWNGWPCYALSAAVSVAAWGMPHSWILTPSYNTLVVQGFLVAMLGVLYVSQHGSPKPSVFAVTLLATGIWLAGLAKPTSGFLLCVAILVYLIVTHRLSRRLFWLTAFTTVALYLATMLAIDGSVSGFVRRLIGGMRVAALLDAGHGIPELMSRLFTDHPTLSPAQWACGAALLAVSGVATRCLSAGALIWRRVGGLSVLLMVGITVMVVWTDTDLPYAWSGFEWLVVLFPILGCALARFASPSGSRDAPPSLGTDHSLQVVGKRLRMSMGLLLLLCPHLCSFGSNNNIWLQDGYAVIFWVYGGILLASCVNGGKAHGPEIWAPAAAGVQLAAVLVLTVSISHPYTQTSSLRKQQSVVTLNEGSTTLRVTPDVAQYLVSLQSVAHTVGYRPAQPVIDLTGYYAASLFAMSAAPIGGPWLIGGQRGSFAATSRVFDVVSCNSLASAWLLVQPEGPIRIPPDVLARYGIDVARDYDVVASIKAPWPLPGVYYEQKLLKPRRLYQDALLACETAKDANGLDVVLQAP